MAAAIDEFDLIARYFAPLSESLPGALGLTDDVGILHVPEGRELVVSADTIVAGVHFPEDMGAADIARRALRVNLSDIAAKGATPWAYTMALQLTDAVDTAWLQDFTNALADDQKAFGPALLGGDTTRTPGPLAISINIFGQTIENKSIKRSGASVGDDVYVTGTVGDSMLGLAALQGRMSFENGAVRDELVARFTHPQPRVSVGPALVPFASAAADVSDGLTADLGHICSASKVAARIELPEVPLSPAAMASVTDNQPLRLSLLSGGDDYEIVFTAPESVRAAIADVSVETGVAITRIGRTVARESQKRPVVVCDDAGRELDTGDGGFRHFRQEDPRGA